MKKVIQWIEYNRFVVIAPIMALIIWFAAVSCTPATDSPIEPGRQVNARELERDYRIWQKQQEVIITRFEYAREDLEHQAEQQAELTQAIIGLASGNVADLPGLAQLVFSGGLLGAISDNIRKRGLIAGLKRNK